MFGGPSAADKAAAKRQQDQTESDLVDSIQSDTLRSTKMRMRTYGLGFVNAPAMKMPNPNSVSGLSALFARAGAA